MSTLPVINQIDLLIVFGIIAYIFFGARSGLIRTVVSLGGIYLAVYAAQNLAPIMVKSATFLAVEETRPGFVWMFLFIFVVIDGLVELFVFIFRDFVSIRILGVLDPVLAVVVSVFKAMLIAGMIIEVTMILPLTDDQKAYMNQSYLREWAVKAFTVSYPVAITFAAGASEYISQRLIPQLRHGSVTVAAAATSEAGKLKSSLDNFLR